MEWIINNKEWIFSGIGIFFITIIIGIIKIISKKMSKRNAESNSKELFSYKLDFSNGMDILLSEMKQDLNNDSFRREFVLLQKGWGYWASGTEFVYYYDDHQSLDNKIKYLENNNCVIDITTKNVKRYKFNENFIEYLKKEKI